MRFVPDRSGFEELARRGRLAFVYKEVVADADTPVSAYAKLGRGPYSFLLESVVGGEKWAAYSFVGVRPRAVMRARGEDVEILTAGRRRARRRRREGVKAEEPVRFLDEYLAKLAPAVPPGLPRFFGGAVGWLGYDIVRAFERLPRTKPDELGPARALLRDHRHRRHLRQPARDAQGRRGRRRRAGRPGARLRRRLRAHRGGPRSPGAPGAAAAPARPADAAPLPAPRSTVTRGRTRRACAASRSTSWRATPSRSSTRSASRSRAASRPVRRLPRAAGHQPVAVHVPPRVPRGRRHGRVARGARAHGGGRGRGAAHRRHGPPRRHARRGRAPRGRAARRPEGARRARHAHRPRAQRRGACCAPGTVRVTETMVIERYSHVMHLVSNVRGQVAPGRARRRRAARLVPRRHALGRAQDPRHGDHRGARAVPARPLRRRRRLHLVHRQPRHGDRHPHARHEGRHDPRAGGRGHRRRQRAGRRARRVPQQGARRAERRRDGAPPRQQGRSRGRSGLRPRSPRGREREPC